MKVIKAVVVGWILVWACHTAASSTVAPGSTVFPTDAGIYSADVSHANGPFSDSYTFNLANYPASQDVMTFFVFGAFNGPLLVTQRTDDGAATPFGSVSSSQGFQYDFAGLRVAQGHVYTFTVAASGPAQYSMVATIPEPEPWALMLVGALLVGYRMRRASQILASRAIG